jgi:hypothetical protein
MPHIYTFTLNVIVDLMVCMNNVVDMIKRNVNTKNIKLQFCVIYISLLHKLWSHVDHLFYSFQLLKHHIINKSQLQLDGIAKFFNGNSSRGKNMSYLDL